MKNLLNCHSIGLHSFPISFENGLYRRIFVADENHNMWREDEIAIHPHHVDIKITVLDGFLFNPIYLIDRNNGVPYNQYKWNSHILNGNGGFEYQGWEMLEMVSNKPYLAGESVCMKACELHTVTVPKNKKCVWIIEESVASCEYLPINYSRHDLTKWSSEGLYIEVDDSVKEKYIKDFMLV